MKVIVDAEGTASTTVQWCRAAAVQRCIQAALTDGSDPPSGTAHVEQHTDSVLRFHGEQVWSKKRIVWWCRNHSYTPWNEGLKHYLNSLNTPDKDEVGDDELSTLTEAAPLLERLSRQEEERKGERQKAENIEDDEEIDIINCDDVKSVVVKTESPSKPVRPEPNVFLQISPSAHYVREVAAQIGVRTNPVEVDGKGAPGIHVHAVEDMIMAVAETLMGDIVRKARARLLQQFTFSDELKARDVVGALTSMSVCDMLTNSGLGKLVEGQTMPRITPTTHPPA